MKCIAELTGVQIFSYIRFIRILIRTRTRSYLEMGMVAQLGSKVLKLLRFFALITTLQDHHDEEIKRSSQFTRALQKLKTAAVQKANQFLDQAHEIYMHCSAESELMLSAKEGIHSGLNVMVKFPTPKFNALNDLIDQMKQSMSLAESHHKEFKDECDDVITCCIEAAEICKCKAKEATDGKDTAKRIGTVVVITSIAGGVVGAFVFGLGLVVVSSAIAGIGALAVTIYLVHEMDQSETQFKGIGKQFDSLLAASKCIREELNAVEMDRMRVYGLLDNLILRRNHHDSLGSVQFALQHLSKSGANIHQTILRCRQCIESRVRKLPQMQPNA